MNQLRRRWRPLLGLTALVLAAHVWLLRGHPVAIQPAPATHLAMTTRTIVLPPPAPSLAAEPVAPTPVRPMAKPMPTPVPRRDGPVQVAATLAPPAAPVATRSAPVTLAFAVAAPVLLRYKVTAHTRSIVWHADSRLHWRHDGSGYEAQLELSGPLFPSRTQLSTGRITAEGLEPRRFSDKARSEEAAHFEREQGKVSFSSNRPDAALAAGAQDRLSVLLQLGAMIAGDPKKFGAGTTIAIQTASTREAEHWHFSIEGEEQLQLPGGTVTAIKLTRLPRKEFDQKVELWLAPGMDYVPVRLRLTQPNGDWVDQQWSSTDRG